MSPKIIVQDGFIVEFHSREEARIHVHVSSNGKRIKVWLEPDIEVATNYGFSEKEIKYIIQIIADNEQSIKDRWINHFCGSDAHY